MHFRAANFHEKRGGSGACGADDAEVHLVGGEVPGADCADFFSGNVCDASGEAVEKVEIAGFENECADDGSEVEGPVDHVVQLAEEVIFDHDEFFAADELLGHFEQFEAYFVDGFLDVFVADF